MLRYILLINISLGHILYLTNSQHMAEDCLVYSIDGKKNEFATPPKFIRSKNTSVTISIFRQEKERCQTSIYLTCDNDETVSVFETSENKVVVITKEHNGQFTTVDDRTIRLIQQNDRETKNNWFHINIKIKQNNYVYISRVGDVFSSVPVQLSSVPRRVRVSTDCNEGVHVLYNCITDCPIFTPAFTKIGSKTIHDVPSISFIFIFRNVLNDNTRNNKFDIEISGQEIKNIYSLSVRKDLYWECFSNTESMINSTECPSRLQPTKQTSITKNYKTDRFSVKVLENDGLYWSLNCIPDRFETSNNDTAFVYFEDDVCRHNSCNKDSKHKVLVMASWIITSLLLCLCTVVCIIVAVRNREQIQTHFSPAKQKPPINDFNLESQVEVPKSKEIILLQEAEESMEPENMISIIDSQSLFIDLASLSDTSTTSQRSYFSP